MPEISGGGYQYPKAVLDAVGKRYLVEHQEAEDGSWWYDLYSDGYLKQGGVTKALKRDEAMIITFPRQFAREILDKNVLRIYPSNTYTPSIAEITLLTIKVINNAGQGVSSTLQWKVSGY